MLKEKGFQFSPADTEITGGGRAGRKLVNLVFNLDEDRRSRSGRITFDGGEVASDGTLRGRI